MMSAKWDALLKNKRLLPKVWDQLNPETRRKLFVGNSFLSFKLWRRLTPKEQAMIKEKIRYKADTVFICEQIRKFQRQLQRQLGEFQNLSLKRKPYDIRRRSQRTR